MKEKKYQIYNVRLPIPLHEELRREAFERRVSITQILLERLGWAEKRK